MEQLVNVMILDDEPAFRKVLRSALDGWAERTGVELHTEPFNRSDEMLEAFTAGNRAYDVAFLDIELQEDAESGIQVAERLRDGGFDGLIVFVTCHLGYMREAFSVETFAYVDKANLAQELSVCMERVLRKLGRNGTGRLILEDKETCMTVKYEDILFISSFRNYSVFHLRAKTVRVRRTLKALAKELPPFFQRVRRTEIVNMRNVTAIIGKNLRVQTGEELPIGPSYLDEVRRTFSLLNRK